MNKSIKGFLMLWVLCATLPVCVAVPGEILHLIANYHDYTGALLIGVIGLVSLVFGSMAFGILVNQLKDMFEGRGIND